MSSSSPSSRIIPPSGACGLREALFSPGLMAIPTRKPPRRRPFRAQSRRLSPRRLECGSHGAKLAQSVGHRLLSCGLPEAASGALFQLLPVLASLGRCPRVPRSRRIAAKNGPRNLLKFVGATFFALGHGLQCLEKGSAAPGCLNIGALLAIPPIFWL